MVSDGMKTDRSCSFPKLFRMLVICRASMWNDIETLVNCLRNDHSDVEIDFDCQEDIDKGMHLWQQQVFEITYIQDDLTSIRQQKEDENEKPWHYQHSDNLGSATVGSMEKLLKAKPGAAYAFLRQRCEAKELPTTNEGSAVDKERFLEYTHGRIVLFKEYQNQGYTPEETVSRTISLYRNHRLRSDPHSPGNMWINQLLTSLDGYLVLSNRPLTWLNCIAHDTGKEQFVYVTNRDPLGDMQLSGVATRKLYLGPVSRDDRRPVWVLVNFLFKLDAKMHEDRVKEQKELLPLPSNEQMSLAYRVGPKGRRVAAFKGPMPASRATGGNPPRIEAAATPLTGVSTVGLMDAYNVLLEKALALLSGPFDSLVLKTVYQDEPRDPQCQPPSVRWPALQSQSHHRTRCLRSVGHPRTLWNTGVTALEMFSPEMLNAFLHACVSHPDKAIFGPKMIRLVVSLGSKFPLAKYNHPTACYRGQNDRFLHGPMFKHDVEAVWRDLFGTAFRGFEDEFPTVEINVRHYLRENIEYNIGGDEYLSPDTLRGVFTQSHKNALIEFGWWLEVLHGIAMANGKQLVLKLPYRSDLLAFIRAILDFYVHHNGGSRHGIHGICLINAFKTSVCDSGKGSPYTPAWYSRVDLGWPDAVGRDTKYQMSGEMLNAARNQLTCKVLQGAQEYGHRLDGFVFRFSGGVVSQEDIAYCLQPPIDPDTIERRSITVQLGTWGLLDLNIGASSLPRACASAPPASGNQPEVDEHKCKKCGGCARICPQKVLKWTSGVIPTVADPSECDGCGLCIRQCQFGAIELIPRFSIALLPASLEGDNAKALNPRFAYLLHVRCTGCGKCSRAFYCDSFLDRQGKRRHPLMDSRNCTGCGLCAQLCGEGALQLFKPKHTAVLVSSMGERSDILRMLMIPHMTYDPVRDLDLLMQEPDDEKTRNIVGDARGMMNEPMIHVDQLIKWAVTLWQFRWQHDVFALADKPEYKDQRWERLGIDGSAPATTPAIIARAVEAKASSLLKGLIPNGTLTPTEGSVILRAFIWSQIIWSDPGQVLWESPIIVVQTTIDGQEALPHPISDIDVAERLRELRAKTFTVRSYYAVLQQGALLERDSQATDGLTLGFTEDQIDGYCRAQMGLHRLFGLDVRACPTMLKRKGYDLNAGEIQHIAGVPWIRLSTIEPIVAIRKEVDSRLSAVAHL